MTELTALPALPVGLTGAAVTLAVVPGAGSAPPVPYKVSLSSSALASGTTVTDNAAGAPDTDSGHDSVLSIAKGGATAPAILASVFGQAMPISDTIQGVAVVTPGTTVGQTNAFGAYVRVSQPHAQNGALQVGVGYSAAVESTVDNASAWGDAIALQDSGAGTGAGRQLVGSERDFNVQKPGTVVTGYLVTGLSQVAPGAGSAAFKAGRANGAKANIYWPVGFQSVDNANTRALEVGTSRDVGELSVNSQLVVFRATNATGAAVETYLFSNAGSLAVEGAGVRDLRVTNGRLISSAGAELGSTTTPGTPYVDLHSSGNPNDGDVRLSAEGGSATEWQGTAVLTAAGLKIGSGATKFQIAVDAAGTATLTAPNLCINAPLLIGKGNAYQANITSDAIGDLILDGTNIARKGGFRFWDGGNLVFGSGLTATVANGVTTLTTNANGAGGATTSFTRAAYTASGAIAITNTLAVLNGSTALAMTLANGTTDGQSILIKQLGTASATVQATIDGASQAVTLAASGAGTIRDSLKMKWSVVDNSWLVE